MISEDKYDPLSEALCLVGNFAGLWDSNPEATASRRTNHGFSPTSLCDPTDKIHGTKGVKLKDKFY